MKKKSLLNPEVYKSKTDVYEEFCEAEDYLKKIEKFLLPKIKNKVVLDLGCGNGKYAKVFAPHSKKYFALDISKEQIKLAKIKTRKIKKIKFITTSAEKIPLKNNSIDVVIALWVLIVVEGFKRKKQILREIERVLKPNGKMWIIENDSKGKFEEMRGHIKKTVKYNEWLKNQKFKEKKIKTYIKFNNLDKAKRVFRKIWGKAISNKLKSNRVELKLIIFYK